MLGRPPDGLRVDALKDGVPQTSSFKAWWARQGLNL